MKTEEYLISWTPLDNADLTPILKKSHPKILE